jgi:hypothetical protein
VNCDYADIRSKIAEQPQWFDENAVPRYCAFTPEEVSNIYASEAVLVEIGCQGCRRAFQVAFSLDRMQAQVSGNSSLADAIRERSLHYGDPPNVRCCDSGPTMNSEPRRVLEYWRTHHQRYVKDSIVTDGKYFEWERDGSLEVGIAPGWVTTP